MSICRYAHWTSPEQSKPPGAAPPHTYGVPICASAQREAMSAAFAAPASDGPAGSSDTASTRDVGSAGCTVTAEAADELGPSQPPSAAPEFEDDVTSAIERRRPPTTTIFHWAGPVS